ncbi:DNA polymerase I [Desulfamplus magnetovallimortis]|uniref:DNA polymerase I n=1 Tax=Desulfamplus magnetovallimortis TaxID=1246637 RepID=A0A1W1H7B3_9BACT|nr:DNA polymerase I [Desulfamplus magnetovallimortis]SLM28357.1 DNA polymerase I [Desulfamplus magnetovallimortis]
MTKSRTLYLIDGTAYLYRAFHAIRNLSNSKGLPTNATYGFTMMLLKLIRDKEPDYAAMFFDMKGPTFRHEIYDQYKANRPPMPEEMAVQIPWIKKIVAAMNIPVVEKQGYEADDLIGTYTRIAKAQGFFSVMVTGDKDFMQLVDRDCVIWDPMKDKTMDVDSIRNDLGIEPIQVIDMLGLAGDTSDNIPGVPGVGPKTALKLISEYGNIQEIYDNLDNLKSKKAMHKKLLDNREQAFLSRRLVTIERSVEVSHDLGEFKMEKPDNEALAELFKNLEFRKLQQEYFEALPVPEKDYRCLTKIDDIKKVLDELKIPFAIDTETTSQHPMLAELVGISFSCQPHRAFYIPLAHVRPDLDELLLNSSDVSSDLLESQPDIGEVLAMLKPILEDPLIPKVGQNIKYDYIVLAKYGIEMQGMVFDTMIASYLLNPSLRGHGLDQIAMDLLGHKTIKYEDVTGKGKKQILFSQVDIETAVPYACEDADITLQAHGILKKRIEKEGLLNLMETIEMPLVPVLAKMEMQGIKVDVAKLHDLSKSFQQEMDKIEKEIFAVAGETFNINSSQQLGNILFEKLKLPVQKKTKKKTGYSTDIDVLTKLAEQHELPALILRFRSLGKLKSTYTDALQQLVHPSTFRIHTSFNQTITATGRLSSSDPNLQNIPIRNEEGKSIRETFIPEKGWKLLAADYSQIELRILAHCAEDKILIEAFTNDEDIHTRTAAEVFHALPGFITDELRRQAKAINFGIVYGMGAFKLAKELSISRKMAQTYIDNYFARYSGVRSYIDDTIAQAREKGEVQTLLGRRRRLDDINASNANVRGFAERMAINTPIQGSAADFIKLAMINMDKALREESMKSRMLLSVHDEILFEVPENEIDALTALAKKEMEGVFDLKVPLKVNIDCGDNWAEAH